MFSIIQAAGWLIWLLIACSIVALALILERLYQLRAARVAPPTLLDEVLGVTRTSLPPADVVNKLAENSVLGGVLASGLRSVIAEPRITEDALRQSLENAGRQAVHQTERYLNTLGTIAAAAPLLGLFGTVIGMIEIFGSQAPGGGSNPQQLAHGISIALYNTAFGLIIAIPSLMFYRYFRGLVDAFQLTMELAAARLVPHLMRFAVRGGGGMNFRGRRPEEPEINLIPFIDVLLVILIFLMLSTTYSRFSELQVALPSADADRLPERPQEIVVAVSSDGRYSVRGQAVDGRDVAQLSAALAAAAGGRSDAMVVVAADALAAHQSVINVLDAARRAGLVRLTFAAQAGGTALTAPVRTALERALVARWYGPDVPLLLRPLAVLYGLLSAAAAWPWRHGWRRPWRAPCPVVVVGNLVAGGAGKTPTVIALVQAMQAAGRRPGVVSRGHGRRSRGTVVAGAGGADDASRLGDEPWLIRRRTGAPLAVGERRVEAAQALLAAHPEVDVLVADDGLQHPALARDLDLWVFDERGAGNGALLPAGPLRQPMPARVPAATRVLYNAPAPSTPLPGALAVRTLSGAVDLADWHAGRAMDPAALAALRGRRVVAIAGIAAPQRFFGMLEAAGLAVSPLPLPDHASFDTLPWPPGTPELLCTEKDAAKLDPTRTVGTRVWVVGLDFRLPDDLVADVLRLTGAPAP